MTIERVWWTAVDFQIFFFPTPASANGARYLYLFDVYPEFNRNTLAPGSRHGDELAFLFDSTKLSVLEDQVSNLFVSFVAAFVKSG